MWWPVWLQSIESLMVTDFIASTGDFCCLRPSDALHHSFKPQGNFHSFETFLKGAYAAFWVCARYYVVFNQA